MAGAALMVVVLRCGKQMEKLPHYFFPGQLLPNRSSHNMHDAFSRDKTIRSEVRWRDQGDFESGSYHMYYSGGESAERGVTIVIQKWIKKRIIKVQACSDRLMYMKLNAEPVDILIMQVYMPTSDHDDEEVEIIYEKIEEIIRTEGRGKVQTIIMGDWNSVMGKGAENNIVGPHGLGIRNRRGNMMVDFCRRNGLVITNTWFKKHHRILYTWKSPGDRSRYQIDYVSCKGQSEASQEIVYVEKPRRQEQIPHRLYLSEATI
ncbi:craniofacial development protein 2-like [Zootermopsis nevadensis]|uniref:craniofacial development protein 2-like n=1 Tax=Zootermopsis nevadensis TaxID=136037 RepID=UPI000B8ED1DA|nr:craniofacial development protein 2-like [Zootermopsis nevadensis]